jgi:hypothetical protein
MDCLKNGLVRDNYRDRPPEFFVIVGGWGGWVVVDDGTTTPHTNAAKPHFYHPPLISRYPLTELAEVEKNDIWLSV